MFIGIKNDEIKDLIVANDKSDLNIYSKFFYGLFFLAIGMICFGAIFNAAIQPYGAEFFLWFIGGGLFISLGLYKMLVFEFVIIDKRAQDIIIEKNYIINILKFNKRVSFSNLKRIEIDKTVFGKWFKGVPWNVNLITFNGIRFIYHSYSFDDAWNVSCKIREFQENYDKKILPIVAKYTRDDLDNIPDDALEGF